MGESGDTASGSEGRRRRVRLARPLNEADAARVVAQALQALDYSVADIDKFCRRAQHIEYGLSAEDEFAAIAAWLGRCRLVHKLDQTGYASPGMQPPRIPDLLMLVEHAGSIQPVLVEVKSTAEFRELRITDDYLASLKEYANALGLPLLFAWRPRPLGWWHLFDPEVVRPESGAVGFEEVAKNDLMSPLLGDFHVVPKKGVGMSLRFLRTGPQVTTDDGFTQECEVKDFWLHNSTEERASQPAEGVLASVMATSEWHQDITDTEIVESWTTTGNQIPAQEVLRHVVGFASKPGERIHWRQVACDLEAILPRQKLLDDLTSAFGPWIQYVFHLVPGNWPDWVPETWRKGTK